MHFFNTQLCKFNVALSKTVLIFYVLKAKVAVQADIDCIAELADFLRFNSHYAKVILERFSFKDVEMT